MISWLLSPLPVWARIILWVIVLAAIGTACVIWVFPIIQGYLPQPGSTVVGMGG